MSTQRAAPPRRRRPRDRKQRIVAAAGRQFWDLGYNQVSMADIAEAVDIGASALYRHFRGKQDLLVAVLDQTLVQLERVTTGQLELADTISKLARIALERREFGVLWDRDAAHLPDSEHGVVRERLRAIISRTTDAVAAELGIPLADAWVRTHALYAILASPSWHRIDVDETRFEELLTRAASAALHAEPPREPTLPPRHTPGAAPQLPASRREAILAAATRLFDQRGYRSVGLTDIGTAIGIAGPSIYNHFTSKTDILIAALTRANESLWLALHHALAAADSPHDALNRVVGSYVAFAVDNPSHVSVLLSEVINLPEPHRDAYHRSQQAYVHEWVALFGRSRPEVPEPEARILVHAALTLINDLVRVRRFQRRSDLGTEIAALSRAVLTTHG